MKKIFAALTLLLAFSINASAQDGSSPVEKGKRQAAELTAYLGLDSTMNENFARLFEQKFMISDDPNTTPERRAELKRIIEAKIRGSLDGTQIATLEKNEELFKRLIN